MLSYRHQTSGKRCSHSCQGVILCYIKILFLKLYYSALFQAPVESGSGVASGSQICATVVLLYCLYKIKITALKWQGVRVAWSV